MGTGSIVHVRRNTALYAWNRAQQRAPEMKWRWILAVNRWVKLSVLTPITTEKAEPHTSAGLQVGICWYWQEFWSNFLPIICFLQGWKRHGSYCYNIGTVMKTFDEAKSDCEASGSYLADVSNGLEPFQLSYCWCYNNCLYFIQLNGKKIYYDLVWIFTGWTMHFLLVWWASGQKNTSGWGCQTRKILMNLCGPREVQWSTLTGTLECQVQEVNICVYWKMSNKQLHNLTFFSHKQLKVMDRGVLQWRLELWPDSGTCCLAQIHLNTSANTWPKGQLWLFHHPLRLLPSVQKVGIEWEQETTVLR